MRAETTPNGRFYFPDERPDLKLPSVTTILGAMSDKSGIEEWKKKVGEEAAARISTDAANRGTFMHLLCENYLRKRFEENREEDGLLKETFVETMEDEEIKKFDRHQLVAGKDLFMHFYRDKIFDRLSNVVIQEVGLWSEKGGGYAGRVDLIAKLVDDTLVVIDFKSSGKPKKAEWIENYFFQAAAYAFAYHERFGEMPLKGEIWISNEKSEVPQVFELSLEDLKNYYVKFIELVRGFHAKFNTSCQEN